MLSNIVRPERKLEVTYVVSVYISLMNTWVLASVENAISGTICLGRNCYSRVSGEIWITLINGGKTYGNERFRHQCRA